MRTFFVRLLVAIGACAITMGLSSFLTNYFDGFQLFIFFGGMAYMKSLDIINREL